VVPLLLVVLLVVVVLVLALVVVALVVVALLVVLVVALVVVPLVELVVALVVDLLEDLMVRLALAPRLLPLWQLAGRVDAGDLHATVLAAVGRCRSGRQRDSTYREHGRDQQADDPSSHSAPALLAITDKPANLSSLNPMVWGTLRGKI